MCLWITFLSVFKKKYLENTLVVLTTMAIKIVITSLKKSHAEAETVQNQSLGHFVHLCSCYLSMFLVLIARALEKAPKIQSLNSGLCEIHANIAMELNRDEILPVDFNRIAEHTNIANDNI